MTTGVADKKLRLPTVPTLEGTSAEQMRAWANSVAELLNVLAGKRTQDANALLDQAVTYRALIDAGIAIKAPEGIDKIIVAGSDVGEYSLVPPPAPTGFTVVRLPFNARLTWDAPNYGNHLRTEVWRNSANNLTTAVKIADVADGITLYEDGYLAGTSWFYWIRFVSKARVAGAFNSISGTSDNAQPGDVTGLTYALEEVGIRLRWVAVIDPDLSVYEIRVGGVDWDSATLLDETKSTSYLWRVQTAGTYRVWVRARDVTGFYSGSATGIDVVIAPPNPVTLGFTLSGENMTLSWGAIAGSFLIDYYEIRYGSTWEAGTLVTRAFSTTYIQKVDWAGVRRFWVATKDVAGNFGTPVAVDVTINAPGAVPNYRAEVIDNNVLLYWTAPTATLPIRTYEIRKGADFNTAQVIGEKDGQFTSLFEMASGTYTYWIRAKDTAGNYGPASALSAVVNQPPDFVLYSDLNVNLSLPTLSNATFDGTGIVLPFNTTETWDTHYTSRGWTDDDDAIAAGFPIYAQPAPGSGTITYEHDYGVAVPSTAVVVTPTMLVIAGSPTYTVQISHKLNIGDAWTDLTAGPSAFIGTSFRYLKVVITATTSGGGVGLYRCTNINVKLAVKQKTLAGQGTANSGDAGGTTFYLTTDGLALGGGNARVFIDLTGPPIVQAVGTTAIIAVVDFTDAPNPESFKVLLFNTSGTRVTAAISWVARGV